MSMLDLFLNRERIEGICGMPWEANLRDSQLRFTVHNIETDTIVDAVHQGVRVAHSLTARYG